MTQAISIWGLFLFLWITPNVRAASNGIFSSTGQKGIVILNNVATNDADFFWDAIRGPGRLEGEALKKSVNTTKGQFVATCSRSVRVPTNTSCTLTFSKLPGNLLEIIVDKAEGIIAAELTTSNAAEVRGQLSQPSGFYLFPDKRLSICGDCGEGNSQVHISWTREHND